MLLNVVAVFRIFEPAQNVIACNTDADDDGWYWSMEAAVTALALSFSFLLLSKRYYESENQKKFIYFQIIL